MIWREWMSDAFDPELKKLSRLNFVFSSDHRKEYRFSSNNWSMKTFLCRNRVGTSEAESGHHFLHLSHIYQRESECRTHLQPSPSRTRHVRLWECFLCFCLCLWISHIVTWMQNATTKAGLWQTSFCLFFVWIFCCPQFTLFWCEITNSIFIVALPPSPLNSSLIQTSNKTFSFHWLVNRLFVQLLCERAWSDGWKFVACQREDSLFNDLN